MYVAAIKNLRKLEDIWLACKCLRFWAGALQYDWPRMAGVNSVHIKENYR